MDFGGLGLLGAIKGKMAWHQTRQTLLAENVANAETPGYRGRDLENFAFGDLLSTVSHASVTTSVTNPTHIAAASQGIGAGGFGVSEAHSFETTPEGNSVVLEDEMMKVTGNLMDYQAATSLYTQSLKIIKTALGRSA